MKVVRGVVLMGLAFALLTWVGHELLGRGQRAPFIPWQNDAVTWGVMMPIFSGVGVGLLLSQGETSRKSSTPERCTPTPERCTSTPERCTQTPERCTPSQAFLHQRIERGLIAPDLVRPRLEGTPQHADVLTLRPTGKQLDGLTELELRVLVTPDGEPQFEATSNVFAHPEALSGLQAGSPVWAYCLPEVQERVAVSLTRD